MAEGFAPQHELRPAVQDPHKVPEVADLGLDRSGGAEQEILRAGPNPKHEIQEIVGLVFSVAKAPAAAGFVGLIEDDGSEFPLSQEAAFLGFVDDEASRDDGDAEGAAGDVFRPAGS